VASTISAEMEFGFLLDPARQLLSIQVSGGRGQPGSSCYDLLASEARLASFVAIAKGRCADPALVPARTRAHPRGSRLGRQIWSGSMFTISDALAGDARAHGRLIEETTRLVVRRQISYGAERGVPWGVSDPPSTRAISNSPISIRTSAFPAWG
jgi:cyclic beta-1,2-glucan synthetase